MILKFLPLDNTGMGAGSNFGMPNITCLSNIAALVRKATILDRTSWAELDAVLRIITKDNGPYTSVLPMLLGQEVQTWQQSWERFLFKYC